VISFFNKGESFLRGLPFDSYGNLGYTQQVKIDEKVSIVRI
jgi:hypothetical protein